MEKDITILGIESSCDETAAAVVVNGRTVLSNEISSQIDIHTLYGGVVPEIASRKHVERVNQVIREALRKADRKLSDLVLELYGKLQSHSLSECRKQRQSALRAEFRLSGCITSRDISAQIILQLRSLSRRFCAWWFPAVIHIL